MSDHKEMTPEKLSEVYARAERWSSVPFGACGSFGDYIRKANAAHDWPGEDRDEVVRSSIDESADDPDEEVAGMLADALRLASRDRADLLAHIDFLTARLDDASAESASAVVRAESAELERDALIEGLGFVEEGPDGRGSGPIFVRGKARVFAGGYDGWVCQRGTISDHFDDLGFALAHAVTAEIEELNAQTVDLVARAALPDVPASTLQRARGMQEATAMMRLRLRDAIAEAAGKDDKKGLLEAFDLVTKDLSSWADQVSTEALTSPSME